MSNKQKGDKLMEKYKLVSEEERFHTPRLAAVKVSYQSENAEKKTINHTIIRSRPSVAVIILNDDNEVALIKQFRTTTGKWYWEIPAGLLEKGESLLEAARREVTEEAGLETKEVKQVSFGPNLLDPSKSDEDYGVAVAHLDGLTSRNLDEQEVIEKDIVWMPLEEVYERLKSQMKKGEPFKDDMYMSGHSVYALLAYKFTE